MTRKKPKKTFTPYYFADRDLQIGFKLNLDSHNISHAHSILTITPKFPDFAIEFRYINKTFREMATIYARLINQYIFKYQISFSASFYRVNREDQRSNDIQ